LWFVNGFLQSLGRLFLNALSILLFAHDHFRSVAMYFIRSAAGGTGGGSIYGADSSSLPRTSYELAAPFQRGDKNGGFRAVFLSSGLGA
jgi:hypothetical protein